MKCPECQRRHVQYPVACVDTACARLMPFVHLHRSSSDVSSLRGLLRLAMADEDKTAEEDLRRLVALFEELRRCRFPLVEDIWESYLERHLGD